MFCKTEALYRPGVNIRPERSNHKWSALMFTCLLWPLVIVSHVLLHMQVITTICVIEDQRLILFYPVRVYRYVWWAGEQESGVLCSSAVKKDFRQPVRQPPRIWFEWSDVRTHVGVFRPELTLVIVSLKSDLIPSLEQSLRRWKLALAEGKDQFAPQIRLLIPLALFHCQYQRYSHVQQISVRYMNCF